MTFTLCHFSRFTDTVFRFTHFYHWTNTTDKCVYRYHLCELHLSSWSFVFSSINLLTHFLTLITSFWSREESIPSGIHNFSKFIVSVETFFCLTLPFLYLNQPCPSYWPPKVDKFFSIINRQLGLIKYTFFLRIDGRYWRLRLMCLNPVWSVKFPCQEVFWWQVGQRSSHQVWGESETWSTDDWTPFGTEESRLLNHSLKCLESFQDLNINVKTMSFW